MEQRISQLELAARMAKRTGITKQNTEVFLRLFFETIREGLQQDKIVKVKGLGTFKLVDVNDRESVDVNTGERIRIEGHTKVTFTPDGSLRDRVNRPFADFDTEVLDDATSQQEMERIDQPVQVNVPDTKEFSVSPSEESVIEEQIPTQQKQPIASQKQLIEQQHDTIDNTPVSTVEKRHDRMSWLRWLFVMSLIVVVGIVCYYAGMRHALVHSEQTQQKEQTNTKSPTQDVREAVTQDTTVVKPIQQKHQPTNEELAQAYPQVEGGEYWIIGEVCVHEMQVGEGLLKIARKELGNSDLMPYIIVFNGIENPDVIPPGAQIRIPRMVRKNK